MAVLELPLLALARHAPPPGAAPIAGGSAVVTVGLPAPHAWRVARAWATSLTSRRAALEASLAAACAPPADPPAPVPAWAPSFEAATAPAAARAARAAATGMGMGRHCVSLAQFASLAALSRARRMRPPCPRLALVFAPVPQLAAAASPSAVSAAAMRVAIAVHHTAMLSGASQRGCLFGVVVPVSLSGGEAVAGSVTAAGAAEAAPAMALRAAAQRDGTAGAVSLVQAAAAGAVAALRSHAAAESDTAASFAVWCSALTAAVEVLPPVPVSGSSEDAKWSVLRPVAVAAATGAAANVVKVAGSDGPYALARSGAPTTALDGLMRGRGVTSDAAGADEPCAVLCSTYSRPSGAVGQSLVLWARLAPPSLA